MSRPNIVFILADDLGSADLSCYGRRDYKTPVLDELASNGIKLRNAYANSAVCSATRVALITGQYQYRFTTGLYEPIAGPKFESLPKTVPTLPGRFKDLGYRTNLIGKWHLGKLPDNGPLNYGYDKFFGFLGGAADYFEHKMWIGKDVEGDGLVEDKQYVKRDGYLTEILGDEAVKVIEQAKDPFLLSLHFNAPHWPWEGPNDKDVPKGLENLRHLDGGNLAVYAEMVQSMDANIGKVLNALKNKGISDNTIVVFTSDNGGERFGDTWPHIGVKGELFEGGLRVPAIIRWPDGGLSGGKESDQVAITMDWVPTLLAAVEGGNKPAVLDGINLLPMLRGNYREDRTLFWRYKSSEQAAVRSGKYKYLQIAGKEYLFDVETDERERANIKKKFPTIFEGLKQKYHDWNIDMLPYPPDSFSEAAHNFIADRY